MKNMVVLSHIPGDIKPESEYKINNDRGSQRKKTEVDEMKPDLGIVYAKTLSQVGTDPENRSFNKRFEHEWANLL